MPFRARYSRAPTGCGCDAGRRAERAPLRNERKIAVGYKSKTNGRLARRKREEAESTKEDAVSFFGLRGT